MILPVALIALSGCKHPAIALVRTQASTQEPLAKSTSSHHEGQEKPVEYSDMSIHEETGDWLGWDLQVVKQQEGYKVTLFCGEGVPEGPVVVHLESLEGVQTFIPASDICGSPMKLEFLQRGVYLKAGEGERELVPRHANFIKQERYK
jgi:hypothetical protein